jgi:DNA-binding transcriptional regulator WhiA
MNDRFLKKAVLLVSANIFVFCCEAFASNGSIDNLQSSDGLPIFSQSEEVTPEEDKKEGKKATKRHKKRKKKAHIYE